MAQVRLQNITKRFGEVVAIRNVSLDVADGEFLVMLGASGAGKTTTLRTIAGLERPEHGQVIIGDRVVNDDPPAERNVAFVFQFYALYPHRTAYQNMASPLEARKLPRNEIDRRIQRVARVLHIEHLLDRRPQQLSGGEQQRVALGRAMVRRPNIFLMDEPLTNLDAKLRAEMRVELKRLQRELGTTTFYVTPDQVEAMSMADRIAVLREGEVLQIGPTEEVYHRPANLYVASFVGNPPMNLLDVVLSTEGAPAVRDRQGSLHVPIRVPLANQIRQIGAQDTLKLGVRPEDIKVSLEPLVGGIPATVYVSEVLGDRAIIDAQVGSQIVKIKASPDLDLEPGRKIWLSLNLDRVHLFDSRSELAIR